MTSLSVPGSSYSLLCQSNGQWATNPTTSGCPVPAVEILNEECPLLPNQSQMTAGSCSTGTVKAGSFQFDTNLNKFTWTCSVCNDGVLQSSAFIQQLMCVNQQLSTCTVSAISCLPGQTRTGNGTTIPFACISTPPPGSGCTNQSVPLLCNVNGIVKTVNASLNLTGAIGSSTPVMNSQASLAGLAFANPAVDFSKSSAFNLQWTCNGSSQWQFSSANGNCVFSSVYNSAAGATCDRHGETPLECTCTDSINATKVFPFVGEISHEECTYGESGSCTQVVTTPGTCDGKIPNYIPVYEPPGGGP